MKRPRSKVVPGSPKKTLRMYTPERAQALERLTRTLWADSKRSLRAVRRELESIPAGGEAPVFAGRARVKLMQGAMRALERDMRELLQNACDEIEAWCWQDELAQSMERWIQQFKRDLAEYGIAPDGVWDEDGQQSSAGFQGAFERFVEVHDDWSFVASKLAIIEAQGIEERELKRTDIALMRIEQRLLTRRKSPGAAER
jgi:hypothetical protein